jgi:hypothetical protein
MVQSNLSSYAKSGISKGKVATKVKSKGIKKMKSASKKKGKLGKFLRKGKRILKKGAMGGAIAGGAALALGAAVPHLIKHSVKAGAAAPKVW